MLVKLKSYTLDGIGGYCVDIEIDFQNGIPAFDIVGLPSNSIKESRDRVRAAINNSSFEFTRKRVTINLAPADTKKDGSMFDLPIALGFLAATEQIDSRKLNDYIILGELSLDGGLRKINGIMPILLSALEQGYKNFIIPYDNAKEASFITNISVIAPKTLSDTCSFFGGILDIPTVPTSNYSSLANSNKYNVDLADVRGQFTAKRALEIAVAGGHNILMSGPPGTGKTMLAKCVPTIMPSMSFREAIEVTKIHSIAGVLDASEGMVTTRPFRSPHHTASTYSITGGGAHSSPGEISLAHNGVLFLDEMPEYPRKTLETLRQPLEDGIITISRVARTVEYPAKFMLIASMNPCPCGNLGSSNQVCTCNPREIKSYIARLSGPLLDRIDLNINVDNVEFQDLRSHTKAEKSADVKSRVEKARAIQLERFENDNIYTNSEMNSMHIAKYCEIDDQSEKMLEQAFKRLKLSARAMTRILKTARTIADLMGNVNISSDNIAESIQYRTMDRKIYN